jgi:hypothetical protein
MTISTTYTQAQLTALETAMATGVKSVNVDGRRVEYNSVQDMEAQANKMRRALGIITDSTVPPVRWVEFAAVGNE